MSLKPKTRSNRNPGPRCDGSSYRGAVEGRVPACQTGAQPEDFPEHTAQQQERVRQGLRILARIIAHTHLGRQAERSSAPAPDPPLAVGPCTWGVRRDTQARQGSNHRPAQDAVRPGSTSRGREIWELLRGGMGEENGGERSPANGYAVSQRTDGNCAATASVRSAVAVRPEQGEAAAPLPVSSSYAAVVGKRPEGENRSNRRV